MNTHLHPRGSLTVDKSLWQLYCLPRICHYKLFPMDFRPWNYRRDRRFGFLLYLETGLGRWLDVCLSLEKTTTKNEENKFYSRRSTKMERGTQSRVNRTLLEARYTYRAPFFKEKEGIVSNIIINKLLQFRTATFLFYFVFCCCCSFLFFFGGGTRFRSVLQLPMLFYQSA